MKRPHIVLRVGRGRRHSGRSPESRYFARAATLRVIAILLTLPLTTQSQSPHTFRITGTILNPTEAAPIPHAHLTATTDKSCPIASRSVDAEADPEGRFTLTLACAGTWHLTAEAPGFAPQSFEQHDSFYTGIVLTAAQPTFDLTFNLTPNSSISGFVLDEAGEAVREAKLSLLSAPEIQEAHPIASTTTDDRGFYEFPNLLPGSYQVAVQTQPWYAVGNASRIRIATEPATSPQTNPPDPSLDFTYPLTFYPGVTDRSAATPIQLTGGASQQADFHLSPIPSIHLIIPEPSGASFGSNPNRRAVNVPPIEQTSALGQSEFRPTSITITDNGIDLGGFAPGTYTLNSRPGLRSRDTSDQQILDLQPDSPRVVDLTAALAATKPNSNPDPPDPRTRLTGTVLFDKKPSQGAMLLLVPSTFGQPHSHTAIRLQQTNTDGSFAFDHLAPGKYILLAIDHGWSVAWRTPATLNPYLLHGTPINLTTSTTLNHPIQAQSP
jgi:hypothetical protein